MRRGAGHSLVHGSPPQNWRVWSALGAIYVIWGSTYLAIRVMVETVPPALGAGFRFTLAGLILLSVLAVRGRRPGAVRISGPELLHCAVVGTLLAAGGNGLVTVAERDVPSGLAALLVASIPLWIVLYRTLVRDRVPVATFGAVALGFLGVGVLLLPGGRPSGVHIGMALLIVLAAAFWGLGSFIAQRVTLPRDPLVSTGWQMLFGGAVMIGGGLIAGEGGRLDIGAFSTKSVAGFAYLVVVGSIIGYSCFAYALAHAPISQVATYAYVNPVIAVVLGAVVLGEHVSAITIAGMALIVVSVALTVRREGRRQRAAARPEARAEPQRAAVPASSRS
jgi:drug/metabolite transporter (DMT)-like permease